MRPKFGIGLRDRIADRLRRRFETEPGQLQFEINEL